MDVGCRIGDDDLAAILPEVEGLDALRVGERPRATLGAVPGPGGRVHPLGGRRELPLAGRPRGEPDRQRRAGRWSGRATTAATAPSSSTRTPRRSCAARPTRRRPTTRPCSPRSLALVATIDARHPSTVHHSENVGRIAALVAAEMGMAARPRRGRARGRPPARRRQDRRQRRPIVARRAAQRRPGGGAAPPSRDRRADALGQPPRLDRPLGAPPPRALRRRWATRPASRARQIPLEARILAVANAFDRLTSGSPGAAPGDRRRGDGRAGASASGSEFDPVAVAALRALVGRGATDTAPAHRLRRRAPMPTFPAAADGAPAAADGPRHRARRGRGGRPPGGPVDRRDRRPAAARRRHGPGPADRRPGGPEPRDRRPGAAPRQLGPLHRAGRHARARDRAHRREHPARPAAGREHLPPARGRGRRLRLPAPLPAAPLRRGRRDRPVARAPRRRAPSPPRPTWPGCSTTSASRSSRRSPTTAAWRCHRAASAASPRSGACSAPTTPRWAPGSPAAGALPEDLCLALERHHDAAPAGRARGAAGVAGRHRRPRGDRRRRRRWRGCPRRRRPAA